MKDTLLERLIDLDLETEKMLEELNDLDLETEKMLEELNDLELEAEKALEELNDLELEAEKALEDSKKFKEEIKKILEQIAEKKNMKETTKIELTYNQYRKLYQGAQFLKVKRNHKIYYINYIRHIGEYYATDLLGRKCDNVEVIGY